PLTQHLKLLLPLYTSTLPFTLLLTRSSFLFSHDTATTTIYTLSLHDALPICPRRLPDDRERDRRQAPGEGAAAQVGRSAEDDRRSEEHTSELQSPDHLVCRLLLEKKKKKEKENITKTDNREQKRPHQSTATQI